MQRDDRRRLLRRVRDGARALRGAGGPDPGPDPDPDPDPDSNPDSDPARDRDCDCDRDRDCDCDRDRERLARQAAEHALDAGGEGEGDGGCTRIDEAEGGGEVDGASAKGP